jgi:hypothetical protein
VAVDNLPMNLVSWILSLAEERHGRTAAEEQVSTVHGGFRFLQVQSSGFAILRKAEEHCL